MAFRDDLSAAQARGDALEREVADLEAENAALRAPSQQSTSAAAPKVRRAAVFAVAATIILTGAIAAIALLAGAAPAAGVTAALGATMAIAIAVVASLIEVAPPGVALVISGRVRVVDGVRRGYRVVFGGRVVRLPIIESVETIDLRPRQISGEQHDVYIKKNMRTTIRYSATVRVAGAGPGLDNAIERFLGRPEEIDRVARESLEGHIRAVCAALELEELVGDPDRFADEFAADAEDSLARLGLLVDILEVETVEPPAQRGVSSTAPA